jgi:APA family basic amino acid/polyamine antiporter
VPPRALFRILGLGFGLSLVVGATIGAGILRTPGVVASHLGDARLVVAVWVFGGLFALIAANTFAELGTMLPKAGGPYVYARQAYGQYVSFVVGWTDWITKTCVVGFLSVVAGEYLAELVPRLSAFGAAPGVSILLCLAILHWMGLRVGSRIQKVMSVLKVAAFLILIVACFLIGGDATAEAASASPAAAASGWGTLLAGLRAMQFVMQTYGGWMDIVYFAEEDVNPSRNIPRSLFGGVLVVMTIYVMFNAAMIYALPMSQLSASKLPASEAAAVIFGPAAGRIITALAVLSLLGILNAVLLYVPRILFALSRDGFFSSKGETVNRGGTPSIALLITTAVAVLLAATGTFEALFTLAAFTGLVIDISSYLSLFVLRKREPDLPRPYRARGYPYLPLLVLFTALALLVGYVVANPSSSLLTLAVLGLSYPAYRVVRLAN